MPWIDPELESHRLTDNLKRVTAMMIKVHDVVLEEDMPMVNQAYMDMVEQGFAEEIPQNELHPSWRSYYLSTRPVIRKGAATTKCRIVENASQVYQNDKSPRWAQRLINLEIPVLVRSLKSSNVELG